MDSTTGTTGTTAAAGETLNDLDGADFMATFNLDKNVFLNHNISDFYGFRGFETEAEGLQARADHDYPFDTFGCEKITQGSDIYYHCPNGAIFYDRYQPGIKIRPLLLRYNITGGSRYELLR
jgi:hypothetical protein